ncbi:MAG: ATP-binding protein, partial [Bacteroidota bacterium]
KVTLLQETSRDQQAGTLMYVPVYKNGMATGGHAERRAAIKGWVYIPIRMNDLMQGILGRWEENRHDRIRLQVYDDMISGTALLYDSQHKNEISREKIASRKIALPVAFNGKEWILLFTQSSGQHAGISSAVVFVLLGGAAISILLLALSFSLFNTRYQAQLIAQQLLAERKLSEERFGILLNSAAEGIYGLDLHGNCTFSNTACSRLLGYEDGNQFLGKNMHDLIHHSHNDGSPFDVESCKIFMAFKKQTGTHVDDEVMWRADGTCFPTEYWSFPIFIDGKIDGAVVTFFDITERKQAESETGKARLEAEQANRSKSEFISRMSHELRTPMNSILGFTQLMEMGILSPAHRKGVNHILKSGKHLLNLINDVLDISRIESGRILLHIETVDAGKVILEVLDFMRHDAAKLNLVLQYEHRDAEDFYVTADRQRLRQVLLNLVNNAVKYNRDGGRVGINTELRQDGRPGMDRVRISVSDTGPGISQGDLLNLFMPFERIGAEKTGTEGTGLGLAVVKQLMFVMKGEIGVESEPGKGSTFWIELPDAGNQAADPEQILSGITPGTSMPGITGTILYVEDNIPNSELVEGILEEHRPGIRLVISRFGKPAIKLAGELLPGLILLDLDLPDCPGDEVLSMLQSGAATSSIPVVVISADASTQKIAKLKQAGACDYLSKPFDVIKFLEMVDQKITPGRM